VREANPNFQIAHFAGALKKIAADVFGLTHDEMYDPAVKEAPFTDGRVIVMDDYLDGMREATGLDLKPAGMIAHSPRELMQFIGTEYVRKAQSDYWVRRLFKDTADFEHVLVPDTRFPNEGDAIRAEGGWVIKTVRIDMPEAKDAHLSETEIDKIEPDLLIGTRTGDLSLPKKVAELIAQGNFEGAQMFDLRGALVAIDECARGMRPWDAAAVLHGKGDKVATVYTLLEYYTSPAKTEESKRFNQ
jgi:hypothetical protein